MSLLVATQADNGALLPSPSRRCAVCCAVHGDGGAVRSYLFVEDVAAAFDTVLHKGLLGEVYNIGTQVERSVVSVAADICRHFNLPQGKIVNVRDRAFNDRWGVGGGGGEGVRVWGRGREEGGRGVWPGQDRGCQGHLPGPNNRWRLLALSVWCCGVLVCGMFTLWVQH